MTASVTCLCGGVALSVHLDPSVDHTQLQLCHCNNCRSVTGSLCISYYLLQDVPAVDRLQEYRESAHVSRFFCPTCGCHIFAQAGEKYLVASGTLIAEDAPPVRSIQHWKVDDTQDGGLKTFLPGPITNIDCRLKAVAGKHATTQKASSDPQSPPSNLDELHAQCHCSGIKFNLTRPDASSFQASSPWPDLLVPYHTGRSENPNHVKWWLRADDTKYLAGTCACPSCRLGSGFPIQAWAFVPKSNIFQSGRPLEFEFGTLQHYTSSARVYREFCRRCGATAFWHDEGRPMLIDISIGLLHGVGARALGWLHWEHDRVSFSETAAQNDLIGLLDIGLRESHS